MTDDILIERIQAVEIKENELLFIRFPQSVGHDKISRFAKQLLKYNPKLEGRVIFHREELELMKATIKES